MAHRVWSIGKQQLGLCLLLLSAFIIHNSELFAQVYTDIHAYTLNDSTQYPCGLMRGDPRGTPTQQIQAGIANLPSGGVLDLTCYTSALTLSADVFSPTTSTGTIIFHGSGLNDLTKTGTFTGYTASFVVKIDGTGTPDTFEWSTNGGSTWTATHVAITGAAQLLTSGVSVTFAATTAHTLNASWTFSAFARHISVTMPPVPITVNANATIPPNLMLCYHAGSTIAAGLGFSLTDNSTSCVGSGTVPAIAPDSTVFGNFSGAPAAPSFVTIPNADCTTTGLVDIAAQVFCGNKTFTNDLIAGSLTANSDSMITGDLTVTGTINGNLSGNADTATALAATPSQCTGGQFATGIAASGDANCGATGTVTSSGYTSGTPLAAFSTATNITPASYSNVVALFSGCSGSQYLGYDGNCHTPSGGSVTSVGLSTDANWFTVANSPVTGSDTITLNKTDGLTANQFLATPNGATGKVSLRSIAAADIPSNAPVNIQSLIIQYPNEAGTGTVLNKIAKIVADPLTAKILTTSDTTVGFGIVVAGAGNVGIASVAYAGLADCVFDGATTAGDYVVASVTSGGECHDVAVAGGFPTGVVVLGKVQSTHGGGGTYSVNLFGPDTAPASSGPGGKGTAITINGSGSKNTVNFNPTTPAAASGHLNLPFDSSASGNITSAVVTPLVSGNTSTLASAAADLHAAGAGTGACADGSGNVTTTGCTSGVPPLTPMYVAGTAGTTNVYVPIAQSSLLANQYATADLVTTSYVVGICIANCDGTQNATVVPYGPTSCIFDNATTAGHRVGLTLGTNNEGRCHDLGAGADPDNTVILGTATETHGGAGTWGIYLHPRVPWYDVDDTLHHPYIVNSGTFPIKTPLSWNTTQVEILSGTKFVLWNSGNTSGPGFQNTGTEIEVSGPTRFDGNINPLLNFNSSATGVITQNNNTSTGTWMRPTGDITGIAVSNDTSYGNGSIMPLIFCQNDSVAKKLRFNNSAFIGPALVPWSLSACQAQLFLGSIDAGSNHKWFGIPAVAIHPAALTGQTGAIPATTLAHPMDATLTRANIAVTCESTSASATVAGNIIFTDVSNTVQTLTTTAAACTALGATSYQSAAYIVLAKADTDIQYSTTIANTPTYTVSVSLETIQ